MKNNIEEEYTVNEKVILIYRYDIISTNRLILLCIIIGSIIGTFFWHWISILIMVLGGWIISIINSIRVSNKIEMLTGLSNKEQAVIWYKMKKDIKKYYEKTKNNPYTKAKRNKKKGINKKGIKTLKTK